MKPSHVLDYDIIILGSGLGGCVTGAILAKIGFRVLIIDAGVHPRFAIGESTLPQTSQLLTLLSQKYRVPELHNIGLGSPERLRENIGDVCGIKQTIGFAFHHLDKKYNSEHGVQFGNVWRVENHLFRQDVDAYLMRVALSYGASVIQNCRVEAMDFDEDLVALTTSGHGNAACGPERLTTRFIIDATGFRSPLAAKFDLRENPSRLRHQSRCLFTHMINVKPFEDCVSDNPLSVSWSKGTLHHVFEGGWMWIIPFNNYAGSRNPLTSVGLTLDPSKYPQPDLSPDEEFRTFLGRLPTVAEQFVDAKIVRPWIRTARLQYSSRTCIGPRYCLLSHASDFVDPLFSRGLINTVEVISELVPILVESLQTGDFSVDKFRSVQKLQSTVIEFADRLVRASYLSWSHFDIWNAWLRVWAIGTGCAESNLGSVILMQQYSRHRPVENPLFTPYEPPGYREFFGACERVIEARRSGDLTPKEATDGLVSLLQNYDFRMPLPIAGNDAEWALRNLSCRDLYIGSKELHARWARKQGDPHLASDA